MHAEKPKFDAGKIERPDPQLWKYYALQSLAAGPFFPLALLPLWFRYETMRYRFDDDGVSLAAFSLRGRIADHPSLRARCVLVDESQDCSTVELAVAAAAPTDVRDGLFLAGEILDLDGPIGGYNFQAAFSTGWLAGQSV